MTTKDKLVSIVYELVDDLHIDEDEYGTLMQAADEEDIEAFSSFGFSTEADLDDYFGLSSLHENLANWIVKDANNKIVKRGLTMQAAYSELEPGWTMGIGYDRI